VPLTHVRLNRCFLSAVCFTITIQAVEKLLGLGADRQEDLIANADKLIVLGCVGLAINLGGMCIFGGVCSAENEIRCLGFRVKGMRAVGARAGGSRVYGLGFVKADRKTGMLTAKL